MSYRFWVGVSLCFGLCGMATAATHQVQVFSFSYSPRFLTIAPGDTVVWTNMGGAHNVSADNGAFRNEVSSSAWTLSHTFTTPGEFRYFCEPHGGPDGVGMSGRIDVVGSTAFPINFGIGGTWSNPANSSQGFLLEVVPSLSSLALGWFTWSSTPGDHFWLSGFGPIDGDTATVTLQRSSGGLFNSGTPTTTEAVGTATFRFSSCSEGTVTFARTDTGESGTIPIQRLTPVPTACLTPATK